METYLVARDETAGDGVLVETYLVARDEIAGDGVLVETYLVARDETAGDGVLVKVEGGQPQRHLVLQLRGEALLHHIVATLQHIGNTPLLSLILFSFRTDLYNTVLAEEGSRNKEE